MEILTIDLAGPLTEMAFKLGVFSVVIAITYLIPFLILKTVFKNNEVANFISSIVLLGCLYVAFQNGIFFDWFLSYIYIGL